MKQKQNQCQSGKELLKRHGFQPCHSCFPKNKGFSPVDGLWPAAVMKEKQN